MINAVTIFGYACLFGVIGMIIGSVITCDILNNKQLRADMGVAAVDVLKEENQKLVKALDKACVNLYILSKELNNVDDDYKVLHENEWLDYLLENEGETDV